MEARGGNSLISCFIASPYPILQEDLHWWLSSVYGSSSRDTGPPQFWFVFNVTVSRILAKPPFCLSSPRDGSGLWMLQPPFLCVLSKFLHQTFDAFLILNIFYIRKIVWEGERDRQNRKGEQEEAMGEQKSSLYIHVKVSYWNILFCTTTICHKNKKRGTT